MRPPVITRRDSTIAMIAFNAARWVSYRCKGMLDYRVEAERAQELTGGIS